MVVNSITKKGYKETKLGLLPEDWEINSIKNISSITTGGKNTQDKVNGGQYPFFVRSQTVERINSFSYDGEAILTAGDGVGTGKVFHYINGKFDLHQRVYKISDFKEKINGYFFFLYFSNNFFNRIMQMTAKSSVDSVRMEMIADMLIPIPSKKEQTLIANALSDIDSLIIGLEKFLSKKRMIKQGAMQKLLKPKKGWVVKKLGEVCDLITKGTTPTSLGRDFQSSGINFIKIESLTSNGKIILEKVAYIDDLTHNLLKRSQLKVGDLLFSIAGALGRVAIVRNEILPANTNQALAIIRMSNTSILNPKYLFIYLNSQKIQNHILTVSVQGAQANLSLLNISDLQIDFPSNIAEQNEIATILSEMDGEIEALQTKLNKYKMVKQGMMQQLLTGKISIYGNK